MSAPGTPTFTPAVTRVLAAISTIAGGTDTKIDSSIIFIPRSASSTAGQSTLLTSATQPSQSIQAQTILGSTFVTQSSAPQATGGSTPADESPTSNAPSSGLIAGSVIGSVAVLVLIGIFVLLYLRHKKNTAKKSPKEVGQVEKHGSSEDSFLTWKAELGTSIYRWELQGDERQEAGDGTPKGGPWELPAHVEMDCCSEKREPSETIKEIILEEKGWIRETREEIVFEEVRLENVTSEKKSRNQE